MTVDNSCAAFDTDFVNHVCQIMLPKEEVASILMSLLDALKVHGVMHPLVFEHELIQKNDCHANLFSSNVISVPSFDDIFQQDEDKKKYYCEYLLPDLYKKMNGTPFPGTSNVQSYWKAQCNLGEIHSIAMCLVCGCGIFLSDDSDSKKILNLVHMSMTNALKVYNRSELIAAIGQQVTLPRSKRKAFSHGIKTT